ncbi:hypothetical protein [Vibrio sp. SCSIO 43137]|uniref:hypothetical protein n=1 Tax=Vibrio sp. SCSIO 43137 TaxID=3021011 RepID=UPI0023080BA6|nr:hypothetical protein [Vibrio sp. SCSIO 43137]WCE31722.1 hypothetical protein PK654_21595 [Vibrio sp. SCSIO 43137]
MFVNSTSFVLSEPFPRKASYKTVMNKPKTTDKTSGSFGDFCSRRQKLLARAGAKQEGGVEKQN